MLGPIQINFRSECAAEWEHVQSPGRLAVSTVSKDWHQGNQSKWNEKKPISIQWILFTFNRAKTLLCFSRLQWMNHFDWILSLEPHRGAFRERTSGGGGVSLPVLWHQETFENKFAETCCIQSSIKCVKNVVCSCLFTFNKRLKLDWDLMTLIWSWDSGLSTF